MWLYEEFELNVQHYRFFASSTFDDLDFPCNIHAFYEAHLVHCEQVRLELETKWRNGFMELMLDRAVDAFAFFEQDEAVYNKSRTKRMLKCLNLRMAGQLRYLLEQR
jgi:hypothetical protein|tara:strand:+ start:168 stop:488 length:321 start_codon:yes stop_codon:yes gene_type:complete